MNKQCPKCGKVKLLSEFYKHPNWKDGHFNECIPCHKRRVLDRIELLKNDPHWVHKERARCRIKQARARQAGSASPLKAEPRKRWELANKTKKKAQSKANAAVRGGKIPKKTNCEACGSAARLHMHHHDYSKPLEVAWLCPACHGVAHRKPFGAPMP
jgi:hypothetical protein